MILVVAEQRKGKLHGATWEAVAAAQQLAGDQPVAAVVLGAGPADAASELSQAAVETVHVVDSPLLEPYTPDAYTDALQQLVAELKPTHVLLPHTYRTRDFAPKLAARLDRALVTDCVGVKPGDKPTFFRPVYQGKLVAEVSAEGEPPHFISVQIGAYRGEDAKRGSTPSPVNNVVVAHRCIGDSRKARRSISGSETGGRSVPGRADRGGRTGHQGAGAYLARRTARDGTRRATGGITTDL